MFKIFFIILIIIFIVLISFFAFQKKSSVISPKIENKVEEVKNTVQDIKDTIAPKPTKILSTGLPNKHLIKTVFIKQSPEGNWDEPWQDACEEAAMLTVDYFYKNVSSITTEQNRDAILKMIDFETTQKFSSDMNASQMAVVAQKYLGYQTKIIDNPTLEDFKKYLSQDIPIIIPADGKILYQENKHFNNGGPYYHNLTVLGYDDTKNQFIVHDVGTKAGAYFKYSYQLLMESIHDFPISGNKEYIATGPKRVLVLIK